MSQSVAASPPELGRLPNLYHWLGFCIAWRAGRTVAFSDGKRGAAVDLKLAMLVVLFGVIVTLSHLSAEHVERMRQRIARRPWRKQAPVTDEI
jgi:hypothetical protein